MNHPDRGATTMDYTSAIPVQQQLLTTIILLITVYYALSYFDSWPSNLKRGLYETSIRAIPSRVIYVAQYAMINMGVLSPMGDASFKREDFGIFKRKEEVLRRMLGQTAIPSVLKRARTMSGYNRLLPLPTEYGPPGLGNWDNSCYQNSVLQGLASLPAFQHYVSRSLLLGQKSGTETETTQALSTFLDQLADSTCQKTFIWTPAVLKSMDSWQQQDAQEYFSRVMDAVEKEALQYTKVQLKRAGPGLPGLCSTSQNKDNELTLLPAITSPAMSFLQNIFGSPIDGMQAQALECQTCGYSEGISLTQFNCLTLSLGLQGPCHLEHLLDDYTEPEMIEGVECDECTRIAKRKESDAGILEGQNMEQTSKVKKSKNVASTKAKQLTLARLPRDLIFHINRSIFDEYGNQRKNSSFVQFDLALGILGKWCAPIDAESESVQATYHLKCIITHSGRHDNGHYVAYGRRDKDWYCFNDETVTKISEDELLHRGNVFMLFYEATDTALDTYEDAPEELQGESANTEAETQDRSSPELKKESALPVNEFDVQKLTSATHTPSAPPGQSNSLLEYVAPVSHPLQVA